VDATLSVEHVTKRFGMGEAAITAVEDVSFDVAEGEFVSLIGPSGCGKSTLFHIIGGLTPPTSGSVVVAGRRLPVRIPPSAWCSRRRVRFPGAT
jgi:ABC-type sugar transport system ATPase subunit